jgi:hypothetical protein
MTDRQTGRRKDRETEIHKNGKLNQIRFLLYLKAIKQLITIIFSCLCSNASYAAGQNK